jgi:hypothetical protein
VPVLYRSIGRPIIHLELTCFGRACKAPADDEDDDGGPPQEAARIRSCASIGVVVGLGWGVAVVGGFCPVSVGSCKRAREESWLRWRQQGAGSQMHQPTD